MKNKKGFTLVELLAAIVILGLLITFAFPTITRMIFKSREKIYIADAQKLVAQAEYRLRANNTEIEKGRTKILFLIRPILGIQGVIFFIPKGWNSN